jgi:hypothetical protein
LLEAKVIVSRDSFLSVFIFQNAFPVKLLNNQQFAVSVIAG